MAAKYSPSTLVKTEPALTATGLLGFIVGVLGFLYSHGVITNVQDNAYKQIAITVIPFLLPIVAGLWIRLQVWAPFQWVEGELVTHQSAVNAPADVTQFVKHYPADLDLQKYTPVYGSDLDAFSAPATPQPVVEKPVIL